VYKPLRDAKYNPKQINIVSHINHQTSKHCTIANSTSK
jgi:hypothetical protein